MASMLAMTNAGAGGSISPEALAQFKTALAGMVSADLENRGRSYLSTDYHPDGHLADAAKTAKIADSKFPWKTNMDISPQEVGVRYGYGAERKILYNALQEKGKLSKPVALKDDGGMTSS